MVNRKFLCFLLMIFFATAIIAQDKKTSPKDKCDFCGQWSLDKVSGRLTTLTLDKGIYWVEQKIRTLTIKTEEDKYVFSIPGEIDNSILELKYFSNGAGETNKAPFRLYEEKGNKYFFDDEKYASKTNANADEINSISRIDVEINGDQFYVRREVNWKLSRDKKELTEKITLENDKVGGNLYTKKNEWNEIRRISFERKYKLVK